MTFWTRKRLIALVVGFLAVSVATCSLPAWSQKPGPNNPKVTASASPSSLTPQAPNSQASWNLTDVLWGIARLQNSPQKLSAEQVKTVRPIVNKVVEGTEMVRGFEGKVKGILTTEQLAYIEHLAATGKLNDIPDLPKVDPGQDPLVSYVIKTLERRVGR